VSFTELGLASEIARAVREEGYETPTPIQQGAIPGIIAGRDLIGCAQTGTGKTAAFTLPLLHRLQPGQRGRLRALILTPTRELALQVSESLRSYGRHLRLTSAVIHGGVGYGNQEQALRRGVDVLVATPGRLLDHMGRGTLNFKNLEVLILDEADRMLDMGFIRDVRRIIAALPRSRQTLLFSATMPDEIRRLSAEILRDPLSVEVAPRRSAPAQGVRQTLLPVSAPRKRDLLAHLLEKEVLGQALVFTRTKHGADKLARHLQQRGHAVAVMHGNRSQSQRVQALDAFKRKRARLMVATDIAGRGIDVEGIDHVVNFDLPNVPEDYVHRVGRTARAGATGDAISLVSPEERGHVRAIEALIGRSIERRVVEGFAAGADAPSHGPSASHAPAASRHPRHRFSPAPRGGGRSHSGRRAGGGPHAGSQSGPRRQGERGGSARRTLDSLASAAGLAAPQRSSGWRGRGVR
jgi:ATP-dependent RNA helicase RhlE